MRCRAPAATSPRYARSGSRMTNGGEGRKVPWALKLGERFRAEQLLYGFLLRSANDGGVMIAEHVSGSVAAFARFTLMLVYAIQGQFSKVRSFVFIDGIDEVTEYFKGEEDIANAIHRVNTEADVVWVDGHSDYGHAFEVFWERYGKDINSKTTVLLLGDARNNYHASQAWVVKEIRQKARKVFWLNPEPRSYWNTGDSIVGDYGTHTDGVYECRNLRQLEAFVEKLV